VTVAILVAVLAAVAGSQYNLLSRLILFPRIPIKEGDLTNRVVMAAALVVTLSSGATLGGPAGVRFHRKVEGPA
jgi:hypothetical protein